MKRNVGYPGRLLVLAAGVLLLLSVGCSAARPLAAPEGFNPQAAANFQKYAAAPPHKAFAIAVDRNGEVHSWARA